MRPFFAYLFVVVFVGGDVAFIGSGLCTDSGNDSIANPIRNDDIIRVKSTNFNESRSNISGDPSPSSPTVFPIANTADLKLLPVRYARFLNPAIVAGNEHVTALKTVDDNEIDDKEDKNNDDPTQPLYGIYNDCLFRLSFQCVQRKLLVFLDRLSRLRSFNLIGEMISVVQNKKYHGPVIKESDLEARLNPDEASTTLSALLEYNLERFLQSHILRVTLPAGITASVSGNGNARSSDSGLVGNTIDINLTRMLEETTGRGKKDKKMKKIMSMMMTGLMGKMAFLGPLMVLLIKLKALKAIILSKIALLLSLMHLFKGKKGGGGGSGHGKEVIIVHDTHGGGSGHESLSSGGWTSGGGGGGGGGGAGWSGGGSGWDSYSAGVHTGGGDATYSGSDTYSTGTHAASGGTWGNNAGTSSWGRRSSNDPHWVAYRAYIPETDE